MSNNVELKYIYLNSRYRDNKITMTHNNFTISFKS